MEYQVPQFIEVEDKIFGPLTLKQFVYLAGGGGLCLALFLSFPMFIAILLSAPIGGLALALAFYKVNGKPFVEIAEAGFSYFIGHRLYLWRKVPNKQPEQEQAAQQPVAPQVTRQKLGLTGSKLHDLAWSLDIKDQNQPPA